MRGGSLSTAAPIPNFPGVAEAARSRGRFRRSERKPQQCSLPTPSKQPTPDNGIGDFFLHFFRCVNVMPVAKMSDARLSGIFLPADVVVDIRPANVFASRTYRAHMQFKILHAQQRLIETSDILEKPT